MAEAQYICSGEIPLDQQTNPNAFSHYGLGIDYYTHYTSPIRRYTDIVVHRQLLACIDNPTPTGIMSYSQDKGYDLFRVHTDAPSLLEGSVVRVEGLNEFQKVTVRGDDVKRELLKKDEELEDELDDDFLDDLLGAGEYAEEENVPSEQTEIVQEENEDEIQPEKMPESEEGSQSLFTSQQLAQLAQHCGIQRNEIIDSE